jgi:hypothetical protein
MTRKTTARAQGIRQERQDSKIWPGVLRGALAIISVLRRRFEDRAL